MIRQAASQVASEPSILTVKLAETDLEVEQALRLRYQVFVEEEKNMRMRTENGLERDIYDAYCDHLIVKELITGEVVGTYRLLPGERATSGIGFYSETEFDLHAFDSLKRQTLELGRSCITPAYRGSRAVQMLWEGIAAYMTELDYRYLIGCASVRLPNLEELNLIYTMLRSKRVITERYGHVTCTERQDGYEVRWRDMRFWHNHDLPFGVDVTLGRDFKVVSQSLGWRKKVWDPSYV